MPRASKPARPSHAKSLFDAGALPKRVDFGARSHVTWPEYVQFMELWELSQGRPTSLQITQLAERLDRCRKQVNVWFSNRRQNIVREQTRLGRLLSKQEADKLLWSKYRETAAERVANESGGSSISVKSYSPVPSLSSESSSGISEWSTTSTDATGNGRSAMDALLEVVNAELQALEACDSLLGVSCQCPC